MGLKFFRFIAIIISLLVIIWTHNKTEYFFSFFDYPLNVCKNKR